MKPALKTSFFTVAYQLVKAKNVFDGVVYLNGNKPNLYLKKKMNAILTTCYIVQIVSSNVEDLVKFDQVMKKFEESSWAILSRN